MKRVLIVDDDMTMLWHLCGLLRRWGAEVHCASNATAGLEVFRRYAFDLVLLDFRMPDHDATWFMRNARLPDAVRVILISACVEPAAIARLRALGVHEFVEKPFDADDLLGRLEACVATRGQGPVHDTDTEGGDPCHTEVTSGVDDGTRRLPRPTGVAAVHAA